MPFKQQGFTLLELMIVVAIIGIIAGAVVPSLQSAKLAANEANAISTLRLLVTAQSQFQVAGAMDNDQDGMGEFGTFAELSGGSALNNRGLGLASTLDPPILAARFRSPAASGVVNLAGYNFIMYLPDAAGAGVLETGGPLAPVANAAVDDDNCEVWWGAYAWPQAAGSTGRRAFFVNLKGEILQTSMSAMLYSGVAGPAWTAALAAVPAPANLGATLANAPGALGSDGNSWVPAR